jgi:hypothetical protein
VSADALEIVQPQAALNQAEAIESLLSRLEAAARTDRDPAEFFQQLLQDLVGALSAVSGAVWSETDQGLACLQRIGGGPRSPEQLSEACERRLAAAALTDRESKLLAPGAEVPSVEAENESTCLQCLAPRETDGVPGFVLRLALRPDASLGARETASGLLAAVADIALSFQVQHRLRTLHAQESAWKELDAAVLAINSTTRLAECSQMMAEQVRRLTGADRASVLVRRGRRCRLTGISSAAAADRRARQVRLIERVAAEVVAGGGSLQVRIGEGGAARHSAALETYLDETQLRTVRCEVLPAARESSPPVGCLVVESFTAEPTGPWEWRVHLLAPHCGRALERALADQRRGWRGWLNPLRSVSRTALWLLAIALLAGAGLALAVVPADFTIEASGRMMPVERRGVFATADAIVTSVLVKDGSAVTAGQPLVTLIDPDLELEFSRLTGELQTAAARLDSVQAQRKLKRLDRDTDASLLSIEAEELQATVAGLTRQLEVVERQRERLTVVSPLNGRVTRWDLATVLSSLPVRHGQVLMDVYNPQGPWRLELDVPDDVSGYVRLAAADGRPRVDYVFQTDPGRISSGVLNEFADATDINAAGDLTVRGLVDLPDGVAETRQRGASVTAKIYCGRRALGFVWFREAIEFVQRRILF